MLSAKTDRSGAAISAFCLIKNICKMGSANTSVETAYNQTITNIGNMPAPFVKYVSTIWNLAFEDDETWD